MKEWIDAHDAGAIMIPFSGALEAKLAEMDVDAKRAFCEESKIASSFDKIIVQGYKSLQLIYFFTAGHDEVKAWTIQVTLAQLLKTIFLYALELKNCSQNFQMVLHIFVS